MILLEYWQWKTFDQTKINKITYPYKINIIEFFIFRTLLNHYLWKVLLRYLWEELREWITISRCLFQSEAARRGESRRMVFLKMGEGEERYIFTQDRRKIYIYLLPKSEKTVSKFSKVGGRYPPPGSAAPGNFIS